MTIEELLQPELDKLAEFIRNNPPGTQYDQDCPTGTRLRLDFEVTDELEFTGHGPADLMVIQMKEDLLDVIENGDTSLTSDPLLKAMDGAVVRGVQPVGVTIKYAKMFAEEKKYLHTVYYTLFINLYVEWPTGITVGAHVHQDANV